MRSILACAVPVLGTVPVMDGTTEDLDPRVAELVIAIRDRFGLRGLRGAEAMIKKEIVVAEQVLRELAAD
jgi:hypothetical protein